MGWWRCEICGRSGDDPRPLAVLTDHIDTWHPQQEITNGD